MSRYAARIEAVGAVSAGAATALRVAMCVRAGKLKPAPSRFTDEKGERVHVRRATFLPDDLAGQPRLVALARRALAEVAADGAAAWPDTPVPAIVALPEPERDAAHPLDPRAMLRDLAAQCPFDLDHKRSTAVRAGHAGGALALAEAARRLSEPSGPRGVLVGGVDSYHHPDAIAWLDGAHRLHKRRVSDGIVPGEGAAFALLRRADDRAGAAFGLGSPSAGAERARGEARPEIGLRAVEVGREEAAARAEPHLSAAMTRVVRMATAASMDERAVDWVMTDVNGEHHRIAEWSKVTHRVDALDKALRQEPAYELGDVGAATGALLTAVAVTWWRAGCAPGEALLIALHAEGAERGAFVLERRERVS